MERNRESQPHIEDLNGALVSIVVPVYNVEPYLAQCVESLLGQTHRKLQLILVDDGSRDGCPAMLDAYAATDARVCVIHRSNGGVSTARNAGLDAAEGDFIGFVDSDDWVEPDFIERLLEVFSAHPTVDVAACGWFVHDHPYGKTAGETGGANRVLSARDTLFCTVNAGRSFEGYLWNKLFRAEIFRKTENGRPRFRLDPSIAIWEDMLLVSEIFASGCTAYFRPDRLYHYRYRADSALRTFGRAGDAEFSARERIVKLCERFDRTLARTAQLNNAKAALGLLTDAREAHRNNTVLSLRKRVRAWAFPLLFAREIPLRERCKLVARCCFPVLSMRIFHRLKTRGAANLNA